jgi:hypothetical protein
MLDAPTQALVNATPTAAQHVRNALMNHGIVDRAAGKTVDPGEDASHSSREACRPADGGARKTRLHVKTRACMRWEHGCETAAAHAG